VDTVLFAARSPPSVYDFYADTGATRSTWVISVHLHIRLTIVQTRVANMALENEINQRKFRNEYQKSAINLVYTYNWVTEKITRIFDEWDITAQQFNILRILRGAGQPLSTLQIRQRMLDRMSDTSRIVDRLVKKGLVKKNICKMDRRLVDVTITDKGKKLLEKIDQYSDQMDGIMKNLTEEDARTLNELLDKIRNAKDE
jgi:DNA-binding MarR family transcriptional regulator